MVNDIEVGQEIRDSVFKGNPYAQLSLIRKSIWAIAVLNGNIPFNSIEEETIANAKAAEIIQTSMQVDLAIDNILKKYYPLSDESGTDEQ